MPKKAASPGRWARDKDKEKFWREKIAGWKASGLSIRAFCHKHQLPESSFNAWRREVEIRDRESAALFMPADAAQLLPETVKDSKGRTIPTTARQLTTMTAKNKEQMPFVPLTVVPNFKDEDTLSPKTMPIEICTPKGFRFRLNCEADVQFLARLIRDLDS